MPTLDQIPVGRSGVIESLHGPDELVQRLLEFGMLEGETIEVIGVAPLGDPVEVRLGNTRLSLRRHDAAGITVRLAGPP
jgi:ferrous iron transport protein A